MKTRHNEFIYGRNPVLELLSTDPQEIQKIYIQKGIKVEDKILELAHENGIPVSVLSKEKIKRFVGNVNHQGVVARIYPVQLASPSQIIEKTVKDRGMVIVVDHVEDPQNLGSIIRTAEVLGATGVIIPSRRSSPLSETVVKVSAGAVFHIPIAVVSNIRNFLHDFKEAGGFVVAVEIGGENLFEFEFPFPLALVIGGEDKGVGRLILKESDFIVTIPMEGKTGSLNAANAIAIAMAFATKSKSQNKKSFTI